jgi:hypothetical protein
MQPDGEPRATLYTEAWAGAVLRVTQLPPRDRQAFGRLLALVEAAWEHLRPAQVFVERHTPDPGAPWSVLVQFLDAEVIDLFRGLAFSLTEYIPGPPCWDDDSDPTNLDADAGLFGRYMEVLYMAADRPDVPGDFRHLVCSCRNGLARYVEEFTSSIAAIEDAGGSPAAHPRP